MTSLCLSSDERVPAPPQAQSLYERADVPKRHTRVIDEDTSPRAWIETRNRITSQIGKGFLIALVGKRGPGKTQIAQQIVMLATMENGREAKYVRAMTFFLDLRATFSDETDSESCVIQAYRQPHLLVIDEMQERGDTEWENRMLNHLIDLRYGDMRDTLLIANLRPKELKDKLGESIMDRMRETGGIIECTWPSFRRKEK